MSAASEELYSLLIPLTDDRLIVPRACVAEVVRFTKPEQREGSLDWMLGTTSWSGRELPVIAYEGVIGKDVPVATGRTRIVVFYSASGKVQGGYFGLMTQGFPAACARESRSAEARCDDRLAESAPVLCRVKMINEFPLIPHLEKLEEMIAEESVQA